MEGKCMFEQKYQGKASQGKAKEDNVFKGDACKDYTFWEMHDMGYGKAGKAIDCNDRSSKDKA
jgi:hypothetical protein